MKRIVWTMLGLALIALLYYLFIKPSQYEVNFKANTLPGDLIETIRFWNRSLDSAKIVEVDSFNRLKQIIVWEKRRYEYSWHFSKVNDSTTKVNIQLTEPNRNLVNKLLIPFTHQAIERDAHDIVNEFYDVLKVHLEITKVKLIGIAELDSSFCVCRSLETSQIEKANGMMKEYSLLTSFILEFKLQTDGQPLVRVREWNHSLGLIKFDFCFPIVETDSLPVVESFVYNKFKSEKVLKAEYYGNYITSDRAWYELIQYAETKGYKTSKLPIEYFYNNPNMGMNEREWKAEVYLPIIE